MKKLLPFFVGVLYSISIYSQAIPNVDWVRNYSEKPAITNIPSAIDASNNVYVTGYTFTGTLYDFTTLKYDQLGNLLWTVHYNGPANGDDFASAIALDGSGNVYVTGKSTGTGTGLDYATVKYNSAGVQQWAVRYNNPLANGDDEASVLLVDNSTGAVYVTGKSRGLTSGDDYTTIKYNSSGVQQWATRYNGLGNGNDKAVGIAFGTGSKLFVTGTAKGILNNDIVTLRYNTSTGVATWTKTYNGTSNLNDVCFGMATDGNDVFICGATQASLTNNNYVLQKLSGNTGLTQWTSFYDGYGMDDFASAVVIDGANDPVITGVSKNTSTYEYHTVKYNSAGVQQWVGKYNANISSPTVSPKLAVDPFNYYYVCGETFNGTNTDFALLQYTTSGVHNWTETHNGSANGNDAATDMVVDNFARIYITGQTYNGSAKYDYTTIKYSQTPVYPIIDFTGEPASSTLQFYENKGQLANTSNLPIPEVKYYTTTTYPDLYFQNTSLSYVFSRIDSTASTTDTVHRIDLQFIQSNPLTKPYNFDPAPDFLNYYTANCPSGITGVKGFQRLMIPNIYPNIDLNYYSNADGLKYYFVVKPGGDPNQIKMLYQGAISSVVNAGTGQLTVNSSIGSFTQDRPIAYQINFSGSVVPITAWQADYVTTGTNTYKFNIGAYVSALPLVIEVKTSPALSPSAFNVPIWGTYFGGTGNDFAHDITYDNTGHTYITGTTSSPNSGANPFPITTLPFQATLSSYSDMFIGKFNDNYSRQWVTYFGGNGIDQGYGIAHTDVAGGKVYICGTTESNASLASFSAGVGSYVNTLGGGITGLIARFDDTTGVREWCTRYGGVVGETYCRKLKCDAAGDVFVVGYTSNQYGGTCADSTYFSVCNPGGGAYYQPFWNPGGFLLNDGFIAKFDNTTQLVWSTYFGGNYDDGIHNLAIDDVNNKLYIVGSTNSAGLSSCVPIFGGLPICNSTSGYNQTLTNGSGGVGGNEDAFVARFTLNGNLEWSTLFGGSGNEYATGVAVNSFGDVYIVGQTTTPSYAGATCSAPSGGGFPNCPGTGYSQSFGGISDDFIAKFRSNTALVWSTFIGGASGEGAEILGSGAEVTVNNLNQVFISGNTRTGSSSASVINPAPLNNPSYYNQATHSDAGTVSVTDAYIVAFDSGNNTLWSSYFGGKGYLTGTIPREGEYLGSIVATPDNRLYLCGQTYSTSVMPLNCPPTVMPYCQGTTTVTASKSDAFIANVIQGGTSSVGDISNGSAQFNVYPNPSNGLYTLDFIATSSENIQLEVFNLLGEKVYLQKAVAVNGKNQYQIDLSKMSNGIYFVNVQFKNDRITSKIIKN